MHGGGHPRRREYPDGRRFPVPPPHGSSIPPPPPPPPPMTANQRNMPSFPMVPPPPPPYPRTVPPPPPPIRMMMMNGPPQQYRPPILPPPPPPHRAPAVVFPPSYIPPPPPPPRIVPPPPPPRLLPPTPLMLPAPVRAYLPPTQAAHPLPAIAPPSDSSVWKEYRQSADGPVYYYNTQTGQSQWERPDALPPQKKAEEAPAIVWKEYTDVATGKHYYSNGTTTTWIPPPAGVPVTKVPVLPPPQEKDPILQEEPPTKKVKTTPVAAVHLANKEEAVAAYTALLLARDISPGLKWPDVVQKCAADPRWEACAAHLSTGERKQLLAEFQSKRANALKEQERQAKVRIHERFGQLLAESPLLRTVTRWEAVRDALAADPRFQAVDSEATRQSLFADFMVERSERAQRQQRQRRAAAQAALRSLWHDTGVSTASSWAQWVASLTPEQRQDPRLVPSEDWTEADGPVYFADYVRELRQEERDEERRRHAERRQVEETERRALVQALRDCARQRDGPLRPSTRWRSVEEQVRAWPSYGPVHQQGDELPREIFEDFVGEWNEHYRRDRSLLSELVFRHPPLVVTEETEYEGFTQALLESAANVPDLYEKVQRIIDTEDLVSSAYLYFRELQLMGTQVGSTALLLEAKRASKSTEGVLSSEDEGEIFEDE